MDQENIVGYANVSKGTTMDISEIVIKKEYSMGDWVRFISNDETIISPSPHQCLQYQSIPGMQLSKGGAVMLVKSLDGLNQNEIYKQLGIEDRNFTAFSLDRY